MEIIIVGCGNVGRTLTEQLSIEGHDITVVEEDSEVIQNVVNNFDVMGIVGNGVSYSIMKDAGIESADLLIAVTESDERNLLCCLMARKAGHCHTIARVRSQIYSNEIGFIKGELGLSMVINPEEALAGEAARLLKFPSANKIDTFAKGRAELVRMTVTEDSILCDHSLKDISRDLDLPVLIGIVRRGDDVFIPDGSFIIRAKDEISVIGTPRKMITFFRKIGKATVGVKSTIIVGGGQTGYYLAKQLAAFGIDIKIFESDSERCNELANLLPEALVIHADGTVTYYCSAEETPEYKAKVEADHKAKREKEAKLRKEGIERSQKAAEERKRIQEESLRKINFESFWYSRIISSQYFVFEDTVDKRLAAYEMENTDL
jgi:trk system potassium uptake protein TrkA